METERPCQKFLSEVVCAGADKVAEANKIMKLGTKRKVKLEPVYIVDKNFNFKTKKGKEISCSFFEEFSN